MFDQPGLLHRYKRVLDQLLSIKLYVNVDIKKDNFFDDYQC